MKFEELMGGSWGSSKSAPGARAAPPLDALAPGAAPQQKAGGEPPNEQAPALVPIAPCSKL